MASSPPTGWCASFIVLGRNDDMPACNSTLQPVHKMCRNCTHLQLFTSAVCMWFAETHDAEQISSQFSGTARCMQVPHPQLLPRHGITGCAPSLAVLRMHGIVHVYDMVPALATLAREEPAPAHGRLRAGLAAIPVSKEVWRAAQAWQLASEAQVSAVRHACAAVCSASPAWQQPASDRQAQLGDSHVQVHCKPCTHIPVKLELHKSAHSRSPRGALQGHAPGQRLLEAECAHVNALLWPDEAVISVPAASGVTMVRACAHAGAVVVGQAEWRQVLTMCGRPAFPFDWPASVAYGCDALRAARSQGRRAYLDVGLCSA